MPLVLVEERDAGRFDLVADAVCLRAVVACAPDGWPRLLEEGVVSVGLVREGADPLSSGTVEDDDGFVTGGPEFLRGGKRVHDATKAFAQLCSREDDERCFNHPSF